MAKVSLLYYTGKGSGTGMEDFTDDAAELLVFTKNTRLNMTPDGFDELMEKLGYDGMKRELSAMAETIPSSWEFVDVVFNLTEVSRACAQQITRTRTGSYAMQSQRVVNMDGFGFHTGPSIAEAPPLKELYDAHMANTNSVYNTLTVLGAKPQDARGILPMDIHCNMVAKYNLRSFVDLVLARRSLRTQDEYADIVDQMYNVVIAAWPWAAPFFVTKFDGAIKLLEEAAQEIGITTGTGPGWKIAKAIDLLRKAS